MTKLPSRLRRLNDALIDLDDDAILLSEADGFLTGLAMLSQPIDPVEWLPLVWGGNGAPPYDDPADVRWLAGALAARHAEIVRDLDRGRFLPIYDMDGRNGDVMWEAWMMGFATALDLRPDEAIDLDHAEARTAVAVLAEIARNESDLTSVEINRLSDEAPELIARHVPVLYAQRVRHVGKAASPAAPPIRIGRNDPCPCGSGAKSKRCCGRG